MRALRTTLTIVVMLGALFFNTASFAAEELTDQKIAQILIEQSLNAYSGNCPCPYNTDRAGRSCGRRSAYSKPGGYSPLCYPADITPEMILQYRRQLQ